MSTTPTTPQWMQDAVREIHPWEVAVEGAGSLDDMQSGYDENEENLQEDQRILAIIAKHAPSPAAETPTTLRPNSPGHREAGPSVQGKAIVSANVASHRETLDGPVDTPSPAAQPTDEAKLREQVMDAVLTYIHAAYFNGGVRDPMFDANLLTDRILAALAPHLSQREPGDSELLDWLETTRRALFTRDSSGVVKFDAETSATDWRCVNEPTFRAAIKSAQRGEGKPL